MPSYSVLALAFVLVPVVRAVPVDEVSARNGISSATSGVGGQAREATGGSVSTSSNGCASSSTDCVMPGLMDISLARVGSGGAVSGSSKGALLSPVKGASFASKVPAGSGFSGASGGGGLVVDNHPVLIELDTDNAGKGGAASGGNSSGSAT